MKLIYLEPDEEITDVFDKISKVEENSVSLVIPRGSTLANSIVNLKLLSKRGGALGKDISLVTNDKIAKNLASQIGIKVFDNISAAKSGAEEEAPTLRQPASEVGAPTASVGVDGVLVHQYDRDEEVGETPEIPTKAPEPEAPGVIEAVKDAEEEIEAQTPDVEDISEKIQEKPTGDYKLIKKPLPSHDHQPSRGSPFDKVRFGKKRRKIIISSIISGAALIILLTLYVVLPKATAKISVISEPFSSSADITINKDVTGSDSTAMTIPGKLVSKEEELEKPFAATGSKNIGEKAKGKITVYNNWDQNPISLPAGTKFSGGGAEFVSTVVTTIPGAQVSYTGGQFTITASGTADVAVEATEVGEQSNIGPADFTITTLPKIQQSKIYGKSTSAMTGGTNNIVKVVADKDLTAAKESTEKELKDNIVNKIKSELVSNEKLLDPAISQSITSENSSNKAGDQVENFNYKVKMKVEVLTFSEDDFRNLLLESAKSKLAADKEIVSNKDQNINYEIISGDLNKGEMVVKGTFSGYIANKYDTKEIKKEIKGKSIRSATTKITAHTGVLSADITPWPRFLRTLPLITRRINIEFNYGSK